MISRKGRFFLINPHCFIDFDNINGAKLMTAINHLPNARVNGEISEARSRATIRFPAQNSVATKAKEFPLKL